MADRVIFVCMLILAGAYAYATEQLPSLEISDPLGPKAFPRLLTIALLVTAFVLLLEVLRARKTASVATPPNPHQKHARIVVALVALWTLLYFIVFEKLGYVVATAIYLIVVMSYFNRGKHVANVLTTVFFCIASYLMFTKALGVNLARGVLPF